VTVGIGLICDLKFAGGPCIIMSVDDKASYGHPIVLSTNACGKFHDILPCAPLAIAISGDISTCDGVVTDLYDQIASIKKAREDARDMPALRHNDFRSAILNARHYEYQSFLDEQLQAYLGITRLEWLKENDREIKRKGLCVVRACIKYFPVGLIIGGFLGMNPRHWILLRACGAAKTETGAQFFTVGIGGEKALRKLCERDQKEYMSAPRSLLHVAEAMKKAKQAYPQAIGDPADYMILRPNKPMMRFKRNAESLKRWLAEFNGKPTDQMQSAVKYRDEFEDELYEYRSVNV
jgi:hypothetical protein